MILSIVFHGFEPISATSAKWLAQGFKQHLYIYTSPSVAQPRECSP